MKKTLLRTAAALLALLTAGTFAACGAEKETQTAEKPSSKVETASPESEPEPGPVNPLLALFTGSPVMILPENPGICLSEQAQAFADAVLEKTGVQITAARKIPQGETAIFFGKAGKTPEELYKDLGDGDFAVDVDEHRLYIVGGSDWALSEAVKQMKDKLLSENEPVELPYIYRADKQPSLLRVGTFNIQHGSHVDTDFSVIGADILRMELDIVGLQEIDMFTTRNGNKDTMKELSEATGYAYYEYSKTMDYDGGQYGHGILSRYPILSYETVLMKGAGEQRAYGHAVIEVDGVQIDWYNTHLAWPDKSARRMQIRQLTKEFNKKEIALLTGDMNAVGTSEYESFFENVGYTNGNEGDYYHFNSCPEDGAIDNVIYKDCFTLLNAGMDYKVVHSDHYMVWAELVLPER